MNARVVRTAIIIFSLLIIPYIAGGAQEKASEVMSIRYADGLLSVKIQLQPFTKVVEALAKQMPLKVYLRKSLAEELQNEKISARFTDEPVQNALRDLFRKRNFLFKFSSSEAGAAAAKGPREMEVWFVGGSGSYANLTAAESAAVNPPSVISKLNEADDTSGEVLLELTDEELGALTANASKSKTRRRALMILGDRVENPDIVNNFVSALEDEDTGVREMALNQILTARQLVDSDVYRRVLNSDSDPRRRKQALGILVFKNREAARGVLHEVRAGNDPGLGAYAVELLNWLDQQAAPAQTQSVETSTEQ
ncbi:MAG: HEAT repeat domain-containing protein [Planctomycetaceae bacterium]|nr:HEAT repeat domain-containing protein [Planctomycetaceae bacterium]